MENENCYIEFDFQADQNFDDLFFVFEKVKTAKNNNQPQQDAFWLKSFPDYSLKRFHFSATDLKPNFETAALGQFTWHFYSLIDLLQTNYDIEYRNCVKVDNNKGRLEFYPWGYPYGDVSGLVTFLRSFNCKSTTVDDGTGVYKVELLENGDFNLTDVSDKPIEN
jgi:hypothetical protein